MDTADIERGGTGGGLRYVTEEPAADMVNQERPHSCQAACARQLLAEAGVSLSEADLLARIGYIDGWGTITVRTANVLNQLHPGLGYGGGQISLESLEDALRCKGWIACLKTDRGTVHAVIVDRLEGGMVHVRDPWGINGPGSGTGTRATIRLADFLEQWQLAEYQAVIPERGK